MTETAQSMGTARRQPARIGSAAIAAMAAMAAIAAMAAAAPASAAGTAAAGASLLAGAASPLADIAPDSVLWDGRPVAGVEFSGNEAISSLRLGRALSMPPGRPWTGRMLGDAIERLLALYRDHGHLSARIDAVHDLPSARGGVHLRFAVDEGPAWVLGALTIRGADSRSDAGVRELLGLRTGQPFRIGAFEAGVDRLLSAYENSGRPFAAVRPVAVEWGDAIALTLAIDEGPLVRVGRLAVRGNTVTQARVIDRLSGLETGAPFAQRELDRARQRLERSGLFAAVEPIRLAQDADRTSNVLLITVREGNPNRVVGILGYSGRDQGLTGLFDLGLGNIAGTGRRARVRWEGRGNGISHIDLHYAEPWVLNAPVTIEANLGRTIQDTLYTLSRFELAGMLELSPDWQVGAGWERESTVQTLGEVLGTERNALLLRGSLDTRDARLNPRQGVAAQVEVKLARKRLRTRAGGAEDETIGVRTATIAVERAQSWAPRHVTLARAQGWLIESDEAVIPFYELYPLGGAASLRGYREEQFRGSRVALLTLEQRVVLDADGSRVFGFSDLGVISTAHSGLEVTGEAGSLFKLGYGVGLRLATRLGMVGVDYGLGEGDGPLDGKIHFLLETAF